jgi:RalA-binding protein 1
MDPKERVAELAQLISRLPLANYSLLRALTAHIILIVQNANLNKMTMRNVGIVFSPTLGIPAGVFSLMLGEFNHVFNVDQGSSDGTEPDVVEITSKAQQTLSPASAATPSKRNSISYSEAAADRMLGFSGRSLDSA